MTVVACCVSATAALVGAAAHASTGSSTTTATAPGALTQAYPLGPQRLCCGGRARPRSPVVATSSQRQGAVTQPNGGTRQSGSSAGLWIVIGSVAALLLATAACASYLRRRRFVRAAARAGRAMPRGRAGQPADRPTAVASNGRPGSGRDGHPRHASRPIVADQSAELAYRRADDEGDATAAFNLGVLLHARRDYLGAIAAYERAEQRGDPDAGFNLGVLLYEAGDLDRAEAAWRRGAGRGHTQAAANLGFLLHRHGELEGARLAYVHARRMDDTDGAANGSESSVTGERRSVPTPGIANPAAGPLTTAGSDPAEAAYRRADGQGDATGAFNLGALLHARHDFEGAIAAYQRAEQRGDPDAAFNLGVLLYEAGDLRRAEAAWRRAARQGHAQATANLGFLLDRRDDLEGARLASLEGQPSTGAERHDNDEQLAPFAPSRGSPLSVTAADPNLDAD